MTGFGRRSWLGIIILIAAALRFYPIWFGLQYPMARPDEDSSIGHALEILGGNPNPRFFLWPSLTFYLFAGVFSAASAVRPLTGAEYTLIGRGIVAFAGTLSVVLLFVLARRAVGERIALVAASFFAVAILHVRESHFAMTDVLMTMFLLVALSTLVAVALQDDADGRGRIRGCAAAGLAAGLATSTKYSAAAVVASMAAVQVAWFVGDRRSVLRPRAWLPSAVFAGATLSGFLLATPYAALDFPKFGADFLYNIRHLSGGHAGVDLGRGWIYHLTRSLPTGVGYTVFAAAVIGVVPFARRSPRPAWVIGAFAVGFYAVIGSGQTVFYRYVLPLVPLICLVSAVGADAAAEWVARTAHLSRRYALTLVVLLTVLPAAVQCVRFDVVLARKDTRVIAAEWLVSHLKPGDSLHDGGSNYTRLELLAAPHAQLWDFDRATGTFSGEAGRIPDWLVLYDSPLAAYTRTPVPLRELAAEQYELVLEIRGVRDSTRSATYDHQDAFFMPLSGFSTVERPGPNVKIYRRR